jgi:hypothetical protein
MAVMAPDRLHAVWEKTEALALSIYTANDGWIEARPTTAPQSLSKMAEGCLEIASELDALSREVAADDKRFAQTVTNLSRIYATATGRDRRAKRLGVIVRRTS